MVQINHHIDLKFAMHGIKYTVCVVHCTVYIVKCYFCIPALPEAPRISSLQPTADRLAATLKSSILDTTNLHTGHCAAMLLDMLRDYFLTAS